MNLTDAKPGMRVIYLETFEIGLISSVNDKYIFVKFWDDVANHNGSFEETTAKACLPETLRMEQ